MNYSVQPSANNLVCMNHVTLRYGGNDIFPATNWTIGRGEQWAVIGPNGSGKSILLRALCGQVPVCKGEIEYSFKRQLDPGQAIAYVSAEEQRAMVADAMDYQQTRWSPVADYAPVTVKDVLRGERRRALSRLMRQVLGMLDIAHLLRRDIGTLSNGEMRKVLVARALLSRPQLLILDDPYGGLDHMSRRKLKLILHNLMINGLPLVISTQRAEEMPRPVTHVLAVMNRQIKFQGTKRQMRWARGMGTAPKPTEESEATTPFRWHACKVSASKDEPLIEVTRANIVYDGVGVLRNVTWTIRQGENWVIRGPNGSGKSSLIGLIIADHPQAYANDIRLFGMQRGTGESIWEIKEHIGWLAPELQYHYHGDVTCFEVVCSGLYDTIGVYREGTLREIRAVRRWMRNVGVSSLADEPFGALSDGQQRMVLLARALVKEPPLIILDEPCQGLDTAHRRKVLGLIDRVARQPMATVVYITHHKNEIPSSFTRELLLSKGRVVRTGTRKG